MQPITKKQRNKAAKKEKKRKGAAEERRKDKATHPANPCLDIPASMEAAKSPAIRHEAAVPSKRMAKKAKLDDMANNLDNDNASIASDDDDDHALLKAAAEQWASSQSHHNMVETTTTQKPPPLSFTNPSPPNNESTTKKQYSVHITQLPYEATKHDIRQHFVAAGCTNIDSIRMVRDHGRPRGVAFVDFGHPLCYQRALSKVHRSRLLGRRLNVRPVLRVAELAAIRQASRVKQQQQQRLGKVAPRTQKKKGPLTKKERSRKAAILKQRRPQQQRPK